MSISFIDIHTHSQSADNDSIITYSIGRDQGPLPTDRRVSAGIHPWDAERVDLHDALTFLKVAPIVAVGEIGLDFSNSVSRVKQMEIFEAQLRVAEQRELPVVIHCVKAYNEVLNTLKGYSLKAVIFHGYIGSTQQTVNIVNRGYYTSYGEISLESQKTVAALRDTPLERLFAETDTGKVPIEEIYTRIAKAKHIDLQTLADAINANYKRIFE